jgi:hypothetical protein
MQQDTGTSRQEPLKVIGWQREGHTVIEATIMRELNLHQLADVVRLSKMGIRLALRLAGVST